jgi:hypothetical protein
VLPHHLQVEVGQQEADVVAWGVIWKGSSAGGSEQWERGPAAPRLPHAVASRWAGVRYPDGSCVA